MAARRLVIWEAIHDNHWVTTIAERSDGTFVALTEDPAGLRLSEVAVTLEEAHDAVRRALARGGHSRCSLGCSEWAMRTTRTTALTLIVCRSSHLSHPQTAGPAIPSPVREGRSARRWSH
jgi:hypothetical protein